MTKSILPTKPKSRNIPKSVAELIGPREWPGPNGSGPQYAAPDNDEVMLARGYIKVATFGGAFEWHKPFLTPRQRRLRQEALEAEDGPAVRCPYCCAPECSH